MVCAGKEIGLKFRAKQKGSVFGGKAKRSRRSKVLGTDSNRTRWALAQRRHALAVHLCKCSMCGSEKEFPAQTIRNKPKGCGCQQYKIEEMKKYSDLAVKAKFVETGGTKRADIAAVKSDKAMIRSKTGVRGVMLEKNGKTYRVAVQVSGERWVKTGFLSIESAKSAYDSKKRELLEKYGLDQMH